MFSWTTSPFSWNGSSRSTGVLTSSATSGWGPDGRYYARDPGEVLINHDVIDGGEGTNRIFVSTVMLVPALNGVGKMIGPNALFALAPGEVGQQLGGISLGRFPASVGIFTAEGSPSYALNYANGTAVPGRYSTDMLFLYNAMYWNTPAPGSAYGLYPYGSFTYGTQPGAGGLFPWGYNYPFGNNPHPGKKAVLGWYDAIQATTPWQGGTAWGGTVVYPFLNNPNPGKKAVMTWYNGLLATTPWLAPQVGALIAGTTPSYVSGQDEVANGSGYKFLTVRKGVPYWSFDAGVTLPGASAPTANLLSAQTANGTPMQAVSHAPRNAADVIKTIKDTSIVLKVSPDQLKTQPTAYTTYLFDEASQNIVEAGGENQVFFM